MSKSIFRVLICGSMLTVCNTDLAAGSLPRGFGSGSVLASIPSAAAWCAGQPDCNGGYPEGIAIVGDRVYVAGPATFGTAGKGPSVVTVIQKSTGQRLTEIPIEGEDTESEHALCGLTVDGDGNVYALSTQLGVIRITRGVRSYRQTLYATALPDVGDCTDGSNPSCSPPRPDLPPTANEMTFDDIGFLYITDSTQGMIFRVPPGGGTPEPWFQSPRLAGNLGAPLPFGANGIKISPDRRWLYVIESYDPDNANRGHVYRIRLVNRPRQHDMERFATFTGGAVPDSLVFGKSERLYVTLAGINKIAVLDENGAEVTRISGPTGSMVPFDTPATMAFDDATRSLLVTNHAMFSDPALNHFAVLRVFVDDKGDPYPNAFGRGH